MPKQYKPPYQFSTHIGATCAKRLRTPRLGQAVECERLWSAPNVTFKIYAAFAFYSSCALSVTGCVFHTLAAEFAQC
jgi:hypothetical protein